MALIKCPECGKEISDKSSSSISCGYPLDTVTTTKDNTEQTDQKSTNKTILECPFNIKEKESYTPISPWLQVPIFILMLILLIAGIIGGKFWETVIIVIFAGGFVLWLSQLLYMLTPFYWKKRKRIDAIYDYFKQRFHTIKSFDQDKQEKILEFNEKKKKKDNDEFMFNVYLKAYNNNADAVIINDLDTNSKELQCVLVKYK